jgi:DNA polymerase-3 subunit delta
MQELINEIRKLIEYVGVNGTITKQDIDNLSIKKIESVIFDLTDSLGKKNVKNAIDVLRNLILAKEPIQKILITLYNHFKKLYLVKLALKNNKDIVYSLDLKPNQMFLVNKYKMQAGYFKIEEIRTILQKLSNLDYEYKIGLIDLETGFEAILCAYI